MKETFKFPVGVARNLFLKSCCTFVSHFFKKYYGNIGPYGHGFIMLVNEISKNIWDHAQGQGFLILEDNGKGEIFFFITDYGDQYFDIDRIRVKGSTKGGNGINFGIGICTQMIESMALALLIPGTFHMDGCSGFTYAGVFSLHEHS